MFYLGELAPRGGLDLTEFCVILMVGILPLAAFVWFLFTFIPWLNADRCPNCHSRAVEETSRVGPKETTMIRKQVVKNPDTVHNLSPEQRGDLRPEWREICRSRYEVTLRCKECGHTWTDNKYEEVSYQSFDQY